MQQIAKDALWVISNIMGSSGKTVSMMATQELFDWLEQSLIIGTYDTKIEVCAVLKNYFIVANSSHIEMMLKVHTGVMLVHQDHAKSPMCTG